jgi:intergrase/recombinase
MQWVFDTVCEKQKFNIEKRDILLIGNPTKEMIDYYWEAINSNTKKKSKIQKMTRKEIDSNEEFEEISDDEMDMLKNVLDGLKDQKRKLH